MLALEGQRCATQICVGPPRHAQATKSGPTTMKRLDQNSCLPVPYSTSRSSLRSLFSWPPSSSGVYLYSFTNRRQRPGYMRKITKFSVLTTLAHAVAASKLLSAPKRVEQQPPLWRAMAMR